MGPPTYSIRLGPCRRRERCSLEYPVAPGTALGKMIPKRNANWATYTPPGKSYLRTMPRLHAGIGWLPTKGTPTRRRPSGQVTL